MTRRQSTVIGIALLLALPWPTPAVAQTSSAVSSSIVGTIKDESGAPVPGVTVEVASPALIGGALPTTTGVDGRYQHRNLPAGTYTILISLQGFQSIRRENFVLPSGFTATLDAVLLVGTVSEAITVSGSAPIIDVKTNGSESVISQELNASIPMGRSMGAIAGLAPGVVTASTSGVDVGGTKALVNVSVQVHGALTNDTTWQFEGNDITAAQGPGNSAGYYNDGLISDSSVITKALPAEVGGGGVVINFNHRSGGDEFHGEFFGNGTSNGFQGNNLTPELTSLGLKAPTKIDKTYDINPSFGGPILKGRLWFYASARRQVVRLALANTFNTNGTQAVDTTENSNLSASVTASVTQNNRVNFVFDSARKVDNQSQTGVGQCVTFPSVVDISATTKQPTLPKIGSLNWQSILGHSVTLETGGSVIFTTYQFAHGPSAGNEVTHLDVGTGVVWGSDSCQTFGFPSNKRAKVALAFETPRWLGTHNMKVGAQLQYGIFNQNGPAGGLTGADADWAWEYRNGAPTAVAIFNLPYTQRQNWWDNGVYIQDAWGISSRLTLNLGLRFEQLLGDIPAADNPASFWVPERVYPEIKDVPNWKTVVPRMAAVYDVTGDGKTAIKVNLSKYEAKEGANIMQAVNPSSRGFSLVPWSAPGASTVCSPTQDATCAVPQMSQLNFAAATAFTGGASTQYAPGVERPYQWEFTASVQRELAAATALTLSYFHRRYYDLLGSANIAVPAQDYIPVTITNPLTGQGITVYNQSPATQGQKNFVTDNYPGIQNVYQGFEATINRRLRDNFEVLLGYTLGSNKGTVTTSDMNNPNLLINNYGNIANDSTNVVNLLATYHMPWEMMLSGHWYYRTGFALQENYTFTGAQVPKLTQVSQVIQLDARGDTRLPSINLLDMRLSRAIRFNGQRLEPMVELYNALNNNAPITTNQTVGTNYGFITENVTARVLKFGVRYTF